MPRFVVLTHDHPKLHWDFMLEHEGILRTWRLDAPPDTNGPISAERLDDHRIAYLDYEGPVSGDRGTVKRWDAGTYETLESTSRGLVLNLTGEKLVGVTPLRQIAGHWKHWRFWRLPPKGPDRVIEIPRLLTQLVAEGRWPATRAEAGAQNRQPLVPEERVKLLAPDERMIYLNCPPFLTVRESALEDSFWCEPWVNPSGIDFDLTIDLAGFEIGSDAPILLDYRHDFTNPRVIRAQWSNKARAHQWILMADDFPTFVNVLGL